MYTRYEARNACFRILKGLEPKTPEIKNIIAEQIIGKYNWTSFTKEWDVVVKNNKIIVVTAIKDINEVSEVCAKRQMAEELGVEKDWSEREHAIIENIEAQFLDGIMTWANYKIKWKVKYDDERHSVTTQLLNINPGQKKITQSDIDRKLQEQMQLSSRTSEEARKAINVHDSEVTLETKSLSDLPPEQRDVIVNSMK